MDEAIYDPIAPARELTSTWFQSSRHLSRGFGRMFRSMAEVNQALLPRDDGDRGLGEPADAPEVAFTRPGWSTERTTDHWEELDVGDGVRFSKVVTERDVRSFAAASGDTNRLHLDDEFAERTRFGGRIAHGTLVSGLISAALARLPGLTIYLSQDLEFLRPVDIGDRLTADVEVVEDIGNGRYRLTTTVEGEDGEPAVDGEAVVIIDAPPEAE